MAENTNSTLQQEAADNLFQALDIITSKRLSSLAFDTTHVCSIESIENKTNGEYRVTDGASSYIAYSDKEYSIGQKVMVRVPNGDMEGQKTIIGLYRSKENDQIEYVSALNNFIDITNNMLEDNITASLKANDISVNYEILWVVTDISLKGYDRLGLGANFKTTLDSKVVKGSFGLRLDILTKTGSGNSENYSYYLDSGDMYGNPYNYSTFFTQEQIFDIKGIEEITGMRLCLYQNNDFVLNTGKSLDAVYTITSVDGNKYESYGTILLGDNIIEYNVGDKVYTRKTDNGIKILGIFDNQNDIFLEAPYVALGYDINTFTQDTVLLGTHDLLTYGKNTVPAERNVYMRWIHKNEKENFTSIDEASEIPPNNIAKIHWYRYLPEKDVHDILAGYFWKEFNPGADLFNYTFEPNYNIDKDGVKVIVEYPTRSNITEQLGDNNSDLNVLIEKLGIALKKDGVSDILINNTTNGVKDLRKIEDLTELSKEYKLLKNTLSTINASEGLKVFEEVYNYILDMRSSTKYYKSDPIYFTNEDSATDNVLELVQGLSILVDTKNYDGIYNLYSSTNEIINRVESTKMRDMTVRFITAEGEEEKIQAGESITWYFPVVNSMIHPPVENKEYNLVSGDEYIEDCGREGYVAIKRTGTDSLEELPEGVQLINIKQQFRIKDYYVQTATNNTIYCELVKKRGTVYTAAVQIFFGTSGSNGTDATFVLKLYSTDENYKAVDEIPALEYGNQALVVPELYDYNNKAVEITDISYSWESQGPENSSGDDKHAIDFQRQSNLLGNKALLTSKSTLGMYYHQNYVLKAEVTWKIEKIITVESKTDDNGNKTEEEVMGIQERDVKLTSYLPVSVRKNINYSSFEGTSRVAYDAQGTNPNYYKNPFKLYDKDYVEVENTKWLGFSEDFKEDITSYKYYPKITEIGEFTPPGMFFQNLKQYSVSGLIGNNLSLDAYNNALLEYIEAPKDSSKKKAYLDEIIKYLDSYAVWIQPVIILQNVYGSSMLNNWDGNLTIDEKNGTILSTAVGAGKKNSDNTFSGILMGDVTAEGIDSHSGIGLYGFDHGEQSYGFNIEGTAFIGKSGKGRINFDGTRGTITSGNYTEPPEDKSAQGAGMKIDLDDSYMNIYGPAGQILLNTKEDSKKALFTIISEKFKTLMLVDKDEYYLQTNNYNIETKEESEIEEGTKFDLWNSTLSLYGKAGQILFNTKTSNENNPLLCINGFLEEKTKTLMEVGENYYLQTLDYDSEAEEPKGARIDLKKSQLDFYGQGGSVSINTSRSDDSNLFTITGKDKETLMKIGNENYYIQTSNYSEEGNKAGVKFDLFKSTLNFFGSGGSLKINTNATPENALFQINSQTNNTLINIGNDKYFIRSNNYLEATEGAQVQVRGLNFDINAGRLYMVKTNSPTGDNAGDKIGTVLISSASGDPYFKITSMYNGVEQTLMHIASSSMYLRSNNYTEQTVDQKSSIRVGTIFNLNAGKLFSVKPLYKEDGTFETEDDGTIKRAGAVTISTAKGDPYFRITTTAGGTETEKPLIYISDSSMYLQTANYRVPSDEQVGQGTRINLNPSGSSSIISYDFMINASNSEGGYIKINSSDSEEYPLQIGEGFKVDWNGNLTAQGAITATAGALGGWYIDENGIYDYNPKTAGTRTGMALLSDGDSSDKNLRIAVGTFNIIETEGTIEGEEGEEDINYIIQSSTDKGFFIYKDGTLKSTGATLISSTISSAEIKDATISRGTISRATISRATITGSCTVSGTLNGGTIKGGTISGGSISVAGLITCGGLQVGSQEYRPRTVGARFVLSANTTSKHACTTETSVVTVSDTTYTSTSSGSSSPGGTCSITINGQTYTGTISVNSHSHKYDKADKAHTASISDSGSFHLYPNTILASNPIIAAYDVSG